MADINKFSEQVFDLAERLADMSDAAKGKGGRRRSLGPKWVVLPAAGAVLYALATSGSFTRQDKGVMNQAKARASELPDDLLSRIRQTSQTSSSGTPASPAARPAPVARPTPPKPVPVADRLSNDR